ncbi:LysR family transcriptional regulator [Vibrio hangzhouensis]|uniref:DNA-binding transcriptional regulator, LysR family n=1 Tax=Vibrio hangzhouensis TaxID=462991 RepID=A0A1H5RUG8_9VIBR|nr:LysR family transcriptional regulator [Vibrio hangzhouensis]SEF41237.1 DNA-binding transcriptional regulator, LysR family [Vibrio hangzhouensis]
MKVTSLTDSSVPSSSYSAYADTNWEPVCFDWNRTRAFLVVAEEGTISAAAASLNLSQPTISRQIAELEKELGVSLFKRSIHRISLTPHGAELLEVVREMGRAAGKFSKLASVKSTSMEGKVIISACEMSAIYRLPAIIAKLREVEPEIVVEVIVASDPNVIQQEVDIAICSIKPSYPNYIARKVGVETRGLFGSKEYLQHNDADHADIDVQSMQIIGSGDLTEFTQYVNGVAANVAEKNFVVSTRSRIAQLNLCLKGVGLALLPVDVASTVRELQPVLEERLSLVENAVWLVCSEDLRRSRRIEFVFNVIADELTEYFLESVRA